MPTIHLDTIVIKAWEDSGPRNSFPAWAGTRFLDSHTEMERLWDEYQQFFQESFWKSLNNLPGLSWIFKGLDALLNTPGDFITWLNGIAFLDNLLGKQNTPLDIINGVRTEPRVQKPMTRTTPRCPAG